MVSARRVVGLSILAAALVGCAETPSASKLPDNPNGELVQIGQLTYANWGVRDSIGSKTRTLDAGDFYFKGTFIQGEPGQKLTLLITNPSQQVHNFSIPAQALDQDIPPGPNRARVDVMFPVAGEVLFFCKYHTALGMNGLLLVGDPPPMSAVSPSLVPSPQSAR
jgi:plastocyanin